MDGVPMMIPLGFIHVHSGYLVSTARCSDAIDAPYGFWTLLTAPNSTSRDVTTFTTVEVQEYT